MADWQYLATRRTKRASLLSLLSSSRECLLVLLPNFMQVERLATASALAGGSSMTFYCSLAMPIGMGGQCWLGGTIAALETRVG
jgi:hypothetical protein